MFRHYNDRFKAQLTFVIIQFNGELAAALNAFGVTKLCVRRRLDFPDSPCDIHDLFIYI